MEEQAKVLDTAMGEGEMRQNPSGKIKDKGKLVFTLCTVGPSLLLFLVFVVVPVFYMFYTSLLKWDSIGEPEFKWFENYRVLFSNDGFKVAFRNTLFLIFFVTLFTIGFALFFAAVLSKG